MISREMMIGGGALVALLVAGSVAYASSSSPAAAAPAAGTLSFTAGHRYEIDLVVPANTTYTPSTMPSATTVQSSFEALASGAFTVIGVGAEVSGTAAPGSGFTAYFIVDCLKSTSIAQADALAGTPAGTTVSVTDEGLTSAATTKTQASYSATDAIPVTAGATVAVPVGSSVVFNPPGGGTWAAPVTTSDASIVAPSVPSTANGFVAVGLGTASLSSSYGTSGSLQTASVLVTVVPIGAGAIGSGSASASLPSGSSSSSSSTPSTSSGSQAVISTTVIGKAIAGGWETDITLGPDSCAVSAWYGDAITIALPSGGTWAATGSSPGFPTSGSTPFKGTYSSPIAVTLAWSLGGVSYATTLTFQTGRTFGVATAWNPNDTVRISLSPNDYTSMMSALNGNAGEIAALSALIASLKNQGIDPSKLTPAQSFVYFLTMGPWAQLLAPLASSIQVWTVASSVGTGTAASSAPVDGQALPTDWPASDTTGIIRAEFQYSGGGTTVAALPFPLTSWVRLT